VRGGEDHHACVAVVAGLLERGDQLVQQLIGKRVARVGLIQRDRGDAVFDLVEQSVEVGQPLEVRQDVSSR
jgi:hypothetical protein